MDSNILEADSSTETSASLSQKEARRVAREKERQERLHGRLTDLRFTDISCLRDGKPDFIKSGVVHCVQGSRSQFDARSGRMRSVMPPLTGDCCQTFSTISAVLLSSLGFAVMLRECCTISTINYLLYISAWMHQLSHSSWPQGGVRPTIGDLNQCLHLRDFFPSRVNEHEFEVVFYNQSRRAQELLRQMCCTSKRTRDGDGKFPICGFVIVSGDYTVSTFAVDHDINDPSKSRYSQAWSFYISDSHGTQPWSQGKASIAGLTFGVPSATSKGERTPSGAGCITVDDGVHYFSTILFVLLEEHRKTAPRTSQMPYMTWTPIRRRRSLAYTAQEISNIIDHHWIPKVLSSEAILREAYKFNFEPLKCFWGTPRPKE